MNCNHQLLLSKNSQALDRKLESYKPGHKIVKKYMKSIGDQMTGYGQVGAVSYAAVAKNEWNDWCAAHAENVMSGHPRTKESNAFQERLTKQMRMSGIASATETLSVHLELDYATEGKEFIFCYYSCSVYNKADGKVHVLFSGWGHKWTMAASQQLDQKWWRENTDNVKQYLAYNAVSEGKDNLERQAKQALRDAEDSD